MKLIYAIYHLCFLINSFALRENLYSKGPSINTINSVNQYKNVEIGYSSSDYTSEDSSIPGSYDNSRCLDNNKISYEFCYSKRNCNICSLSQTCGWCVRQNRCMPVNTLGVTLCDDNCGGVVKLEQCASLYIKKHFEEFNQIDNMKKPQFSATEIERKYHYGINNEVYSKILRETLGNSTEGIAPVVSAKYRFKQRLKPNKSPKTLRIKKEEELAPIRPEAAAENIISFIDNHLAL